jgi:hypothetical protein
MWNARVHEDKKVCSNVKHIRTSGGECKRLNPMTPKCTPTLGITFALGEKPHFSTTFQLSFIVENIIFNCKMFFATQKWFYQLISKIVNNCRNPSFGLTTKARACKVAGQERKPGSVSQESVREWTLTLRRELPPWELDSQWTPKCLKSNCRGQNPMEWGVPISLERYWNVDV